MVTSTRTVRQVSSLPTNSMVVGKTELQATNSVRLSDILNEQTGIITVPDFGGGEGVQMQGFDSEHILILIDGVPLIGRQAGTLDLDRITVANVKQIEVVRGASSCLYGNEALGGVVNIITERPVPAAASTWSGEIGHRYEMAPASDLQTHDLNLGLTWKNAQTSNRLFTNGFRSSGYDLSPETEGQTLDPFASLTIDNTLAHRFSDRLNGLLNGRYFFQNQTLDFVDENLYGFQRTDEWNARLKTDYAFSDQIDVTADIYATNYRTTEELFHRADDANYSRADFDQWLAMPELRAGFQLNEQNNFVAGLGWRHERLDRDLFAETAQFDAQYAYLQHDFQPTERLNFLYGVRFDHHSAYASQLSPKLAIRYLIADWLAVKSSFGAGFKAPDFRQLYFDFTNLQVNYTVLGFNVAQARLEEFIEQGIVDEVAVVLPESVFAQPLAAERSRSINAAVQFRPSSAFELELNAFHNEILNLIDIRVAAGKTNGQNVFTYLNVDREFTRGIELSGKANVGKNWQFSGGYQHMLAKDRSVIDDAFNDEGISYARNPETNENIVVRRSDYFGLFNRSRHLANFKVFYKLPKWKLDANVRLTYRSRFGLFDANGNGFLDEFDRFVNGFFIADFALNKSFDNGLTISTGSNNLANFTDPSNLANLVGRSFYGRIQYQF